MIRTPQTIYDFNRTLPDHDMIEYSPFLRMNAHGNILEIGVRKGVSTSAFLLGIAKNRGHLYSVDKSTRCAGIFDEPQDDWTFIPNDSKNVDQVMAVVMARDPGFRLFDIVFIDGDHTREGVRADLWNYGSAVRPGGMILCHDIFGRSDLTQQQKDEDWPTPAVGEEYIDYAVGMGWPHFELPGVWGMGMIVRP